MPGLTDDEMEKLVITDELVYFSRKDKVRIFPREEGFCFAEALHITLESGRMCVYLQMKYLDHSPVQTLLYPDSWETLYEWLESIGCNTCLAPEHLEAINPDNIAHASPDGSEVMIEWKDETQDLFSAELVSRYKIPVE